MEEKKVTPIKDETAAKPQNVIPFEDLTKRVAGSFSIEPTELWRALKSEFFPNGAASDAQMFLALQVIDKYQLNPFAHEIYAAISKKTGKLLIGVQYDGFNVIAHRHPRYKGFKLERELDKDGKVVAVICKVWRDDWEHPGEYYALMSEWFIKGKDTWEQRPVHQLGVKAFNNCVKLTLGLSGLYDKDDIERIQAAEGSAREQAAVETVGRDLEGQGQLEGARQEPIPDEEAKPVVPEVVAEPAQPVQPEPVVSAEQQADADASAAAAEDDMLKNQQAEPTKPNVRGRLETFIAQKVTEARLNLLLGREGVDSLDKLSDEGCERMLNQLEKRGK